MHVQVCEYMCVCMFVECCNREHYLFPFCIEIVKVIIAEGLVSQMGVRVGNKSECPGLSDRATPSSVSALFTSCLHSKIPSQWFFFLS